MPLKTKPVRFPVPDGVKPHPFTGQTVVEFSKARAFVIYTSSNTPGAHGIKIIHHDASFFVPLNGNAELRAIRDAFRNHCATLREPKK